VGMTRQELNRARAVLEDHGLMVKNQW